MSMATKFDSIVRKLVSAGHHDLAQEVLAAGWKFWKKKEEKPNAPH